MDALQVYVETYGYTIKRLLFNNSSIHLYYLYWLHNFNQHWLTIVKKKLCEKLQYQMWEKLHNFKLTRIIIKLLL